jgi:hypothetical protein
MNDEEIRVAHAIPGRIRVKIDRLKGNAALAEKIWELFVGTPGVRRVETSTTTGSFLVLYDGQAPGWHDERRAIAEKLAPVSGLGHEEMLRRLGASRKRAKGSLALEPHHVTGFFESLNEQVRSVTGGTGLKLLVPLALVLLGVRGLMAGEQVAAPRWYDLMWFGFAAFLMLNAAGVSPARAAEEAAEVAAAL